MNNECFDSHPGRPGKIPGVGTIIIHFLGEQTKQKVPFLLEIARFMKTNLIKGVAWRHRKFQFKPTRSKLAWLGFDPFPGQTKPSWAWLGQVAQAR